MAGLRLARQLYEILSPRRLKSKLLALRSLRLNSNPSAKGSARTELVYYKHEYREENLWLTVNYSIHNPKAYSRTELGPFQLCWNPTSIYREAAVGVSVDSNNIT